jgi:hypothetical protein
MAAVTGQMPARDRRSSRRRRIVVGFALAATIVAGAVFGLDLAVGSPSVPAGSAAELIAVVKNDSTAAGIPDPEEAESGGGPLVRRACLDRISRPAGWLGLCWTIGRMTDEVDPAHDEYILRVVGTLHGEPALSGLRWAVIRAWPDAASAPLRIVDAWPPTSAHEGPCQEVSMPLGFFGDETDTICGRTVGEVDQAQQRTGLEWTCAGCLLGLSGDQPVLLVVRVAVDEGRSPVWDLYADVGSS